MICCSGFWHMGDGGGASSAAPRRLAWQRLLLASSPLTASPCQLAPAPPAGPEQEPITFVGRTPGRIVPARGDNQFGWDPVFEPEGFDQTYAELDKDIKNKISHRSCPTCCLCRRLLLLPFLLPDAVAPCWLRRAYARRASRWLQVPGARPAAELPAAERKKQLAGG